MENIIQSFLNLSLLYFESGLFFSLFFYWKGIGKIDETAKGSTNGFKVIVFPGILVFWPVLLFKWIKSA